jgi:hypothetical protein
VGACGGGPPPIQRFDTTYTKNCYITDMISKILLILIILAIAAGVYYFKFADKKTVNSYQECVDAGGALLESFPEQCVYPGTPPKTFTNPSQSL